MSAFDESCPFEEGDLVRLRSGGPTMTVEFLHPEDGKVSVAWITPGSEKVRKACFNFPTLEGA